MKTEYFRTMNLEKHVIIQKEEIAVIVNNKYLITNNHIPVITYTNIVITASILFMDFYIISILFIVLLFIVTIILTLVRMVCCSSVIKKCYTKFSSGKFCIMYL